MMAILRALPKKMRNAYATKPMPTGALLNQQALKPMENVFHRVKLNVATKQL
jgi:hypothetical protein